MNRKLIIAVSVLFIILLNISYNWLRKQTEDKLPDPAVITEPLNTHYLADVKLNMPSSWKSSNYRAIFFPDKNDDEFKIEVSESNWRREGDVQQRLSRSLDMTAMSKGFFADKTEELGRETLMDEFERPAGLMVHFDPIQKNKAA